MSKKITFSAFGRDSYYHRDWFKKNGFKFDRSARRWTVNELPIDNAEEFASYCRKYGLTFERSDRVISEFDMPIIFRLWNLNSLIRLHKFFSFSIP
jgi:hypothetical protein